MTGWPLEPGERIRWEGRPAAGFSLAPVAGTVKQIVLVWGIGAGAAGAFAVFAGATEIAGPLVLGLAAFIALQVVLIGWWNMRSRTNTDYAVTDRRVLKRNRKHPAHGQSITPYDPATVAIRPTAPPGILIGRGPLLFHGEAGGTMATLEDFCLDLVDNAEQVAELVRDAARRNAPDQPEPVRGLSVTATSRRYRMTTP